MHKIKLRLNKERFEELMHKTGHTPTSLAYDMTKMGCSITANAIYAWLKRTQLPSSPGVAVVAEIFGVKAIDLFERDDSYYEQAQGG